CLHQMRTNQIEQQSLPLSEIRAASVECDPDNQRWDSRKHKRHLVLYSDPPVKIRVKSDAVEFPASQKVRHLQDSGIAASSVVVDQRVLRNVLVKNPVAVGKIECVGRIGDRRILLAFAIYFVVGGDIGTHELGNG